MKSCGWVVVLACVILANGVAEERAPAEITFKNKELEDRWNSWPEGIRKLFESALGKATVLSLKGGPLSVGANFPGMIDIQGPEYKLEAKDENNARLKLEVCGELFNKEAGWLEYIEFKMPRKDLPQAVLDGAARLMPNAEWAPLARLEGTMKNPRYTLYGKLNGKKVELLLNDRGEVPPEFLNDVALVSMPKIVREAALKQMPERSLRSCEKWKAGDGTIYFVVKGVVNVNEVWLRVSEDGRLLEDGKR